MTIDRIAAAREDIQAVDDGLVITVTTELVDPDLEPDPWADVPAGSLGLSKREARRVAREVKAAQRMLETRRAEARRAARSGVGQAPSDTPRSVPVQVHREPRPTAANPPEARSEKRAAKHGKPRFIAITLYLLVLALACAVWYFAVGTLVVSRGTAAVSGWDVTSVATGSMRPALEVGDLVAYAPTDPADIAAGQIIVFDNPAKPGMTTVHRVVRTNPDGTFTTKGDANAREDSTPVPPDNVRGVAKMVSPFGGYPTMLLDRGQVLALVGVVGTLILAALIVHGPVPFEDRSAHSPRA